MAGTYGYFNKGTNGGISSRDEDFDEEDVWALVKERTETSPKVRKSKDSSSVLTPRGLPTASRMIPRASSSFNEAQVLQQSAPVNIPDWSKIYRKNSRKGSNSHGYEDEDEDDDDDDDDDYDNIIVDEDDDVQNDVDYGDDSDKIPPHEWIAKKLARSQISSFSVCEGAGRTLKGRDLSKVRNAVLTRTGFLE
ncbi:Senescence regulator S40 [Macleaya cordata]|uniref:Senescence regulator S40 n=1 Tax=Macleaya cordata TaxID=56857 RepID=A0A200PYV8_MACCD|nr:Senescence regulator S40 [Macleaya cordata]